MGGSPPSASQGQYAVADVPEDAAHDPARSSGPKHVSVAESDPTDHHNADQTPPPSAPPVGTDHGGMSAHSDDQDCVTAIRMSTSHAAGVSDNGLEAKGGAAPPALGCNDPGTSALQVGTTEAAATAHDPPASPPSEPTPLTEQQPTDVLQVSCEDPTHATESVVKARVSPEPPSEPLPAQMSEAEAHQQPPEQAKAIDQPPALLPAPQTTEACATAPAEPAPVESPSPPHADASAVLSSVCQLIPPADTLPAPEPSASDKAVSDVTTPSLPLAHRAVHPWLLEQLSGTEVVVPGEVQPIRLAQLPTHQVGQATCLPGWGTGVNHVCPGPDSGSVWD